MHSDIKTLERTEIIRDLRLGVFDVLVGINLLREGIDVPEVSLVAILDADKEGFLRNERGLIQTIGRRPAILKAMSSCMPIKSPIPCKRTMDETARRREIQMAYNEEHGIIPQTIKKEIRDLIAITKSSGTDVAEESADYSGMNKRAPRSHQETSKANAGSCRIAGLRTGRRNPRYGLGAESHGLGGKT